MLSATVVEEVKRLLAAGCHSQRQIARMLAISRGSVATIASGKRRERPRKTNHDPWESDPWIGPRRRCPDCGGQVYLPCRLCGVRRLVESGKLPPLLGGEVDELALELRDEHRRRYRQIFHRRQARAIRRSLKGTLKSFEPLDAERRNS